MTGRSIPDVMSYAILWIALSTVPAMAQDSRPAASAVGSRLDTTPLKRNDNRIQNRVQSRIRNRIDRYYDPQANATSPFKVASDQGRAVGRPPGR